MSLHIFIKAEPFLFDRHIKRFLAQVLEPATRDFNFDKLSALNTTPQQVVTCAQSLPMMADKRVVLVDEAEDYNKDDWEALLPYCESPSPQTELVIVAKKLDKRLGVLKKIIQCGALTEFALPSKPWEVPAFILNLLQTEAKQLGLTLAPGSAEVLIETSGPELYALLHELEKLRLYKFPDTKITRDDVLATASQGHLASVFVISEKMGRRDLASLSEIYARLVEQGESPIGLTAILISHMRKLLVVREGLDKKLPDATIMSQTGLFPKIFQDYRSQAGLFSFVRLKRIFRNLMTLSEDLRRSRLSTKALMGNFFQDVCLTKMS
jgi:DNA polymerase-3 subunit delta